MCRPWARVQLQSTIQCSSIQMRIGIAAGKHDEHHSSMGWPRDCSLKGESDGKEQGEMKTRHRGDRTLNEIQSPTNQPTTHVTDLAALSQSPSRSLSRRRLISTIFLSSNLLHWNAHGGLHSSHLYNSNTPARFLMLSPDHYSSSSRQNLPTLVLKFQHNLSIAILFQTLLY